MTVPMTSGGTARGAAPTSRSRSKRPSPRLASAHEASTTACPCGRAPQRPAAQGRGQRDSPGRGSATFEQRPARRSRRPRSPPMPDGERGELGRAREHDRRMTIAAVAPSTGSASTPKEMPTSRAATPREAPRGTLRGLARSRRPRPAGLVEQRPQLAGVGGHGVGAARARRPGRARSRPRGSARRRRARRRCRAGCRRSRPCARAVRLRRRRRRGARAIGGSAARSSSSEPKPPWPRGEVVAEAGARELEPRDRLEVAGDQGETERRRARPASSSSSAHARARPCRDRSARARACAYSSAGRLAHLVGARVDPLRADARGAAGSRAISPSVRPAASTRAAAGSATPWTLAQRRVDASRRARPRPCCSSVPSMSKSSSTRRPASVSRRSALERCAARAAGRTRRSGGARGLDVVELRPSRPASACSAAGRDDAGRDAGARDVDRVGVGARSSAPSAATVNGMPSASAVSCSSSNTAGGASSRGRSPAPSPSSCLPSSLISMPGRVGGVGHVDDDRDVGLERERGRARARRR